MFLSAPIFKFLKSLLTNSQKCALNKMFQSNNASEISDGSSGGSSISQTGAPTPEFVAETYNI